jgi:hypothetical protein
MPKLLFNLLGSGETEHELPYGIVTIGRHPDNAIVIEDVSVSGHHGQITSDNGKFILHDLSSSNGTMVNGQPINEAELHDGDTILLGSVDGVFQGETATVETPLPQEKSSTFGSKLASFGKAAYQETKRNAQLASLKTQIEKLKLVDVNKAYYTIGRKAYELKIASDRFGIEYSEIAEIEKTISTKREGVLANADATTMEKVKGVAISAKMGAEAEGLELKLKQRFTKLGHNIIDAGETSDLTSELNDLQVVESHIAELEKEYSAISADHSAQAQIRLITSSLAKDARTTGKGAWVKGLCGFKRQGIIAISILICVILVVAFQWSHNSTSKRESTSSETIEDVLAEKIQTVFSSKKQDIFNVMHPVGTATRVKVHDVSVVWKNENRTNLEKDILQFTVRFTVYWQGPITTDGYTKATQTYDEESDRWIGGQVLSTNGITNTEVRSGAIDFGIGFLQGYLEQQQQQ